MYYRILGELFRFELWQATSLRMNKFPRSLTKIKVNSSARRGETEAATASNTTQLQLHYKRTTATTTDTTSTEAVRIFQI